MAILGRVQEIFMRNLVQTIHILLPLPVARKDVRQQQHWMDSDRKPSRPRRGWPNAKDSRLRRYHERLLKVLQRIVTSDSA